MSYWNDGVVLTGLLLAALLFAGEMIRKIGPLARLGIPVSILAGVLGLIIGPDVLGILAIDREILESVVYHGLAIVFIAVSLQSPPQGARGGGVTSIAFAVPFMSALQGLVGIVAVLVLSGFGANVHPGFGMLLPLGFEQGPGQALSVGSAWESSGLTDGAQVGLIIAAIGYGWGIVFGVPLVFLGRARGWFTGPTDRGDLVLAEEAAHQLPAGALEVLSRQLVAIAVVYGITYAAVAGLASALSFAPGIAAMVWGFHFIVGGVFAMGVRWLLVRTDTSPLNDELLGRVNGVTVDVITCAALAAVQIGVFRANWVPIVVITTVGGALTLGAAVWLAWRAFPDEPFEHAVVVFGMATGTLPLGLALLRIVDPELRGIVPTSCVLGSGLAVPLAAPLVLFLLPMPVLGYPGSFPGAAWTTAALMLAYLLVTVVAWRFLGPLRFKPPVWGFVPKEAVAPA